MSYWTRNCSRITEEPYVSIINEEYQEAKRRLAPRLSAWHRSAVKFYWSDRKISSGGTCFSGLKKITMNKRYRDDAAGTWSPEMFRMTVRHEICHLIESNHGSRFLRLLELLQGHRFVGAPAYERKQPTK